VPFALGHGLNPLVSHYVAFPAGINLMWNTSVLLPSFLLSPVTVLFGAPFSYNVLMTLCPALSATFAYLAFRRWTSSLPSLCGGLVFGFSPYMMAQAQGHLVQTMIMSGPLMLVLLDRLLVAQSGPAWRTGLLLGLLGWAQLLTGEEVLALEGVSAVIAVAVLCTLARRQVRAHFPYARDGTAVAALVFAVLSAPFLAVQLFGPYKAQDVHPPNTYVSDLLNFFVPTHLTELAPATLRNISSHFLVSERGAYIGVPLVCLIVLTLWLARRRLACWVALGVAASAAILSAGSSLHVDGHKTDIDLLGGVVQRVPLLHNLLPEHFEFVMTLGVAWLVALGLEEVKCLKGRQRLGAVVLATLGLVSVFPTTNYPDGPSPLDSAFGSGFSCPHHVGSSRPPVALLVPATNEMNLRWQSESDFCFVLPSATGTTGTNGAFRKGFGILLTLGEPGQPMMPTTPTARAEAAQEIRQLDITEVLVGPESPTNPPWSPQGQAEAVVWLEWLLGQAPQQSRDPYVSYVWKYLPPLSDIASGHVGYVRGEA
jgi:hypothetical protein